MNRSVLIATILAFATAAQAAEYQKLVMPAAPAPAKQTLPMNAQVTSQGVYVPVNKSGTVGVSVQGLSNPAPGEKGGSVGLTFQTK